MTAFEKAWYDHFDYIRRTPKDSIRHPGYTGPSGQDRRSHFRPDMMWLDRNPMDEGGWQRGIRREESGGRKTDNPSGWAVSRSDGYTNEEERRYKLDLALARLPLELNRPLKPGEILGLVEHEDDLQYLVDTGVMPSVLGGNSLDQVVSDLEEGVKDFKDVIGEAIEDGWIPPSRAGESKDEYYMSHAALDRLTMLDRMRAVINARLMDVPKEQLLTLVDDKSMAPKVMEDWYQHTKPIGFGHGDWLRHTPITAGALVRDTKNLSRLDGPPNIFDDIMGRIGNQPELKAMFRRLLSSEAADLLNTMDERRELDRIDPRGMPFSDAPSWFGPVQGPMEDFGDVEIRGQDPFSEEFQIMNRSSDSFEDAWGVVKMPYHGTTTGRLKEIMEQGLKPKQPDPFTPPSVSFTEEPRVAATFAGIRSHLNDDGDPVVLHFPDSALMEEPVATVGGQGDEHLRVHHTIPPSELTPLFGPKKPIDIMEDEVLSAWYDSLKDWEKELMESHRVGEIR